MKRQKRRRINKTITNVKTYNNFNMLDEFNNYISRWHFNSNFSFSMPHLMRGFIISSNKINWSNL